MGSYAKAFSNAVNSLEKSNNFLGRLGFDVEAILSLGEKTLSRHRGSWKKG
ncbi:hypothetical protein [Butyrivibrio sp. LC3010]|uniref:hypothetical protein n=1 Tax=Butyrivibrio sp. LC3010 TaxID=1280680 RepID=UPI0003FFEC5D|nr:hypothetical protein [Butyrivibrio sp. LC3010]